jgi:uncharacterized protein
MIEPPILHLSIPVGDLGEALAFYVDVVGCRSGRVRPGFADVFFYGCQLTLHERPEQLLSAEGRGVRHFGVTLDAAQWRHLVERLEEYGATFVAPPTTDYAGTPAEQTKAMVVDPSGNAVEIKTYADPSAALSG